MLTRMAHGQSFGLLTDGNVLIGNIIEYAVNILFVFLAFDLSNDSRQI